jgi:hypothetical protein
MSVAELRRGDEIARGVRTAEEKSWPSMIIRE